MFQVGVTQPEQGPSLRRSGLGQHTCFSAAQEGPCFLWRQPRWCRPGSQLRDKIQAFFLCTAERWAPQT